MNMEIVWVGIKMSDMKNFNYRLTTPRLILFIVLVVSGFWHFAVNGFEGVRSEEIWLGLVLLVALLGSVILRFAVKRKRKE